MSSKKQQMGEGGGALALPGEGDKRRRFARIMRRQPTDAERKLWYALRSRRFANCKFRRQVLLGRYIADFLSFEAKLIVEVDGGQHNSNRLDAERDNWFRSQGYSIIHVWNIDVLTNLEGVLAEIEPKLRTPHPSRRSTGSPPSPAGGEGCANPSPPVGEGGGALALPGEGVPLLRSNRNA